MDALLPLLAVAAGFAATVGALTWLASRVRRRGIGANVMATVDEVFRPTAHQSYLEIRTQDERRAPDASADDQTPPNRVAPA